MTGAPRSILFICGENALRSPMAEAMVKAAHGDRVFVDSIGVRTGGLDPMAVVVMDEVGIDISGHRPKTLDDLFDMSFDVIVALSEEALTQAQERTRGDAVEILYWPIDDPSLVEGNREVCLDAYRQTRDALRQRIADLFDDRGEDS